MTLLHNSHCTRARRAFTLIGLLAVPMTAATLLVGCNQPAENQMAEPATQAPPAQAPPAKNQMTEKPAEVYRGMRGQIAQVLPQQKAGDAAALVIDHEAIPKFMAAMRMTMPISPSVNAKGLKKGDKISFDMTMRGGNFFVENVKVLPPATKLKLAEHK